MQKELEIIKKTILEVAKKYNVEIDKIILFGSRARGDYREDSDWDILVVTKKKLKEKDKWAFWEEIMKKLTNINIDLFITSIEDIEKYKTVAGTLERYATLEGKTL